MAVTISGSGLGAGSVPQAALAAGVAGLGPMFAAYQSAAQSLTTGVYAKITCTTEEADSHGYYDATLSRFTPLVPGWYLMGGSFQIASATTALVSQIYKNGAAHKTIHYTGSGSGSAAGSAIVYANGSTDYFELWGQQAGATQNTAAIATGTYFWGVLVRSA